MNNFTVNHTSTVTTEINLNADDCSELSTKFITSLVLESDQHFHVTDSEKLVIDQNDNIIRAMNDDDMTIYKTMCLITKAAQQREQDKNKAHIASLKSQLALAESLSI